MEEPVRERTIRQGWSTATESDRRTLFHRSGENSLETIQLASVFHRTQVDLVERVSLPERSDVPYERCHEFVVDVSVDDELFG